MKGSELALAQAVAVELNYLYAFSEMASVSLLSLVTTNVNKWRVESFSPYSHRGVLYICSKHIFP